MFSWLKQVLSDPSGNPSSYDFDDTTGVGGGYGSFQIHNTTNAETVFAWNYQSSSIPNIGFGNNPNGQPDWTFDASFTQLLSAWKLTILVN